jgi:ubiquinone/menaquinone biosynthesis C-methylase UbiE
MNRWRQFYTEDPRVLSAAPSDCALYAVDFFRSVKCNFVLDLACGNGRDSTMLACQGLDVTGVDEALPCLQQACRLRRTGRWAQADARSLPFPDGGFDGVYCYGLLHEFTHAQADQDALRVMDESFRVLRTSGYLILAVLAGDPTAGLPHVRLFDEDMLDRVAHRFELLDKGIYTDRGCTGTSDYRIWRGTYRKAQNKKAL